MIIKKLHRKKNHRTMLFRNQVTSLLLYEKIVTTKEKAKITKGLAEKIINIAKAEDLNSTRQLHSYLLDELAINKLKEVILPRVKDKTSGYFTTYYLGNRLGDGSAKYSLQFTDYKPVAKVKKEETEESAEAKTKTEIKREKRIENLSKEQIKGEVKTVVRKKGERRISGEK